MSGFEFENMFGGKPRLDLVEAVMGEDRLSEQELRISHAWAVEQASAICTEDIVDRPSGGLMYTTAYSKPQVYTSRGGDQCRIRLALSSGPKTLFDETPTERVQLGVMDADDFIPLVTLWPDRVNDRDLMAERFNDPADLHCLMQAVKFFADAKEE